MAHRDGWFTYWSMWFSVAMLNYQRVDSTAFDRSQVTFLVVRKTPHSLLTVPSDSGSKLFASRQIHQHKKNRGFIVPSHLILKAPPRNHALVGDLHIFGNIEWGCFSYEQGMRPKPMPPRRPHRKIWRFGSGSSVPLGSGDLRWWRKIWGCP